MIVAHPDDETVSKVECILLKDKILGCLLTNGDNEIRSKKRI